MSPLHPTPTRTARPGIFRTFFRSASLTCSLGALALLPHSPAFGAEDAASNAPANLSRLLGGAKVQVLDSATGLPVTQPGLVAAIDDDVSSGWTPNVGKTLLLISLPKSADLSSFSLFAPGAEGSFKVHVISAPGEALEAAASGKAAFGGNFADGKATGTSATEGQFLLIELDLTTTAPIRSIDTIGRPKPGGDNFISVVSPVSGEQNSGSNKDGEIVEVNFAADALGAKVSDKADAGLGAVIDGDTATSGTIVIAANQQEQALIDLAAAVEVKHVSLSFAEAKGKVTFIATDPEHPNGRVLGEADLDGTSKTLTLDVPGISAQSISILWEPTDNSTLVVSELGVFALARVHRERVADESSSRFRIDIPNNNDVPAAPKPPIDNPLPPKPPGPPQPPIILPPSKPVSA